MVRKSWIRQRLVHWTSPNLEVSHYVKYRRTNLDIVYNINLIRCILFKNYPIISSPSNLRSINFINPCNNCIIKKAVVTIIYNDKMVKKPHFRHSGNNCKAVGSRFDNNESCMQENMLCLLVFCSCSHYS